MEKELYQLQLVIDTVLNDRRSPKILDAGCGLGSNTYLSMPENAFVVGIDISEKQLLKNSTVHEKILGDIQSYELPSSEFDAIICWWVLEHVPQPERALNNFLYCVKEDGIIILAVPNVFSIKGLLTKFSPQWFHDWYYRAILGHKGYSPFPTYLKFSISPAAIRRFAIKNDLSIAYSCLFAGSENKKIINVGLRVIRQTIKVLTFGKIDVGLTEFIIVLKKQKVGVCAPNTTSRPKRASGTGLRS